MDREYLFRVKTYPKQSGRADLIKHLEGKRLSKGQAIKAKCYDCNGMGESYECDIETCSLYPYSPYKIKPGTHTGTTGTAKEGI